MSASDSGQIQLEKSTKTKLIFGSGFLGCQVGSIWADQGEAVFVVSRTPQNWRGSNGFKPTQVVDVSSAGDLRDISTVLFAAGMDDVDRDNRNWLDYLNIAISLAKTSNARLIFTSSTGVYHHNTGELVDESSETVPSRARAKTCLRAEQDVRNNGVNFLICRIAGLYGPDRLPSLASLQSRLQSEPDNRWLNLVHVADAAKCITLLDDRLIEPQLVNLSDGSPVQRSRYLNLLCETLGIERSPFSESPVGSSKGKRICNERLINLIGNEFQFMPLLHGLQSSVSNSMNLEHQSYRSPGSCP